VVSLESIVGVVESLKLGHSDAGRGVAETFLDCLGHEEHLLSQFQAKGLGPVHVDVWCAEARSLVEWDTLVAFGPILDSQR
jgi:hypothetical protein